MIIKLLVLPLYNVERYLKVLSTSSEKIVLHEFFKLIHSLKGVAFDKSKFRLHDEIYIKDPLIMEDILYFEQVDRKSPWESFRLMILKGDLLMLFQVKFGPIFRPRFRIYANKSSDNFAKNSKKNASLYEDLSFLGELKGRI